jgi:hypothetical protein
VKALPNFVSAITADGLAMLMHQPPTATMSTLLGATYETWLNKRAKEAHDILLSEIAKRKRLSGDVEPDAFFGLLHRYLNATKQGVARRNLHLMAQVIRGSLEQDCPFQPDKLASCAEQVAELTRDEIKFLAVFWSSHIEATSSPSETVDAEITAEQRIHINTQALALERLVPCIFPSKLEFSALAGALTRTELIVAQSVWGGTRFDITPRLGELINLCDLESISSNEY